MKIDYLPIARSFPNDFKVQNEFLAALLINVFQCEHLLSSDYQRIQELNTTYQDLPADFTDLSLIAISARSS
jgi:uncharacterized protein